MAVLGLRCYAGSSLVGASRGYSPGAVCRLLTMVASPAVEHRLQDMRGFSSCDSQAPEHRLSSSGAGAQLLCRCGIFPDHRSNPCLLHQQAGSLPWNHQGSPETHYFLKLKKVILSQGPMFQNFMQQESFSWPVSTQIPHTSPFMGHHYPYHSLHNQSYKKKKGQKKADNKKLYHKMEKRCHICTSIHCVLPTHLTLSSQQLGKGTQYYITSLLSQETEAQIS